VSGRITALLGTSRTLIDRLRSRGTDSDPGEATVSSDDASVEYDPEDGTFPAPDVGGSAVVGPDSAEATPTSVRTDDTWSRVLWIAEYPDAPSDGFLETLYATAETRRTDITIHLDPRDTHATLDALENQIEALEADLEYLNEKRRAGARGIKKDLEDHQELYDVLRNTSMTAFDASMYLRVSGGDPDDIDTAGVRKTARQTPANLTPVAPRWTQADALVSCSPVGADRLDETMDTTTPMLAGAVGAMFPFVSGTVAEPGVEYGTYALNESPMILDRFARETGYCMMTIGKLGAGKSFATKLQVLRRVMYDEETVVVMLDPLEGFAGIADALGGEHITVGGTRGLNPLEIKPTPPDVLARTTDIDPWAEQITWVLSFFDSFFSNAATNPLADRKQTLRRAVQEAYEQRGITRDPTTHDRDSPTVRDVIDVLEELVDSPGPFGYGTAGEREQVRTHAQTLLTDLRPSFRAGGDLANLAKPTSFDLDSKVVYLDLHQQEGARGETETSLMMQVLFNAVYERAKQTPKRVVFVIDEAHYLMNDAGSLEFLETAVRHSRHYDLSLQFVTQTGGEFTLTPEARTIANLCSMTMLHRVDEEADKLADWFDLSEREANWVRTAKAGNDADGYSEALLGIDEEGWFPVRIRASDIEQSTIDGG